MYFRFIFFFKDMATTEIYTYAHTRALHDALPIGQRLPAARHPDPVPDPGAGRCGPEHPGGLLRPDLAGHRRFHGGGRLCGMEFRGALPGHADRKSTTSELPSLMRISYAVFCLKKKNTIYRLDSQIPQYLNK